MPFLVHWEDGRVFDWLERSELALKILFKVLYSALRPPLFSSYFFHLVVLLPFSFSSSNSFAYVEFY